MRAATCYGLTNQRAIILRSLLSRTTNSFPLRALTHISLRQRSDGSGTIVLVPPQRGFGRTSGLYFSGMGSPPAACERIPDARGVHEQLLEAIAKSA